MLRSTLTLAVIALSVGCVPAFSADITTAIAAGKPVTFDAFSEGTAPITFEWFRDDIKVGEGQSFTIGSLAPEHAGAYTAKATNAFGSAVSTDREIIIVGVPPTPPTLKVTIGGTRMVSKKTNVQYVAAVEGGTGTATYQWEKNGVPLAGETGSTLNLSFVNPSYEGRYAVNVRKGTAVAKSNESQRWVLRN